MNRREFVIAGAAGALLRASRHGRAEPETSRNRLGIVEHSYTQRIAVDRARRGKGLLDDPAAFVAFCHERGAAGVQLDWSRLENADLVELRKALDRWGMFLEASIRLPENPTYLARFHDAATKLRDLRATVLRTVVLPGRRYEQFRSMDQFRATVQQRVKPLGLVKSMLQGSDLFLAIENHKDWRTVDMVELLERLDCPNIGVCLDTGNSIALLEDPMETVEALAPWAFSTHLKDMAIEPYADGFLLSEVPLGRGFLDLPRIVETIRNARPGIHFNLEMITRDPLKVPCLTKGYWATLDGLSGWALARTLKLVRERGSKTPLPRVSGVDDERKLKVEDDNVRDCLKFAREHLGV